MRRGTLELVHRLRARGITVSTIGLGRGVDAELLRSIAVEGGGRLHLVAEPAELPGPLASEARAFRRAGETR